MACSCVAAVVGPTASGKSELAIRLAHALRAEVINGDAMQLYRGLNIGTAKTTSQEREGIPHHLLDVLDIQQPASVAQFQQQARSALADCQQRGVLPLLVGGSSLYLRAVIDDLEFPGTDPQVRQRFTERLEQIGAVALHEELRRVAPQAAEAILPSNGRRIVRALEVTELTGKPFQATMPEHVSVVGSVAMVGISVERSVLDERIAQRVDQMWQNGLLDEVRALRSRGLCMAPTASRALGYPQAIAQLDGEFSQDQAKAATVRATSQFARRQERLFRRDRRIVWLAHDSPTLLSDATEVVRSVITEK